MFDKLFDFLLNFLYDILPVFFVKQYDNGVMLRMGKFRKVVTPGPVFKIPFIDKIETQTIVTTTLSVPTQSVMTKDKKHLVVKSVVKFKIADVQLFMMNVYDAQDAIADTTQSIVKALIADKVLDECSDNEFDNTLTKKLRNAVKQWGIDIQQVTLTDIGQIKSLRLFNEGSLLG